MRFCIPDQLLGDRPRGVMKSYSTSCQTVLSDQICPSNSQYILWRQGFSWPGLGVHCRLPSNYAQFQDKLYTLSSNALAPTRARNLRSSHRNKLWRPEGQVLSGSTWSMDEMDVFGYRGCRDPGRAGEAHYSTHRRGCCATENGQDRTAGCNGEKVPNYWILL